MTYCVVADETVGRQIPMAFLERVKDDFVSRYGGGMAVTSPANSLNKEFGSKLKEHMQYCVEHPEEISKLAKVKAQVSEVKGVMMENIEKVLDRGGKIELLVDKTENLHHQAQDFQTSGMNMRRKIWLQNMKIKLIVLGILIALILVVILSACGGFNCGKKTISDFEDELLEVLEGVVSCNQKAEALNQQLKTSASLEVGSTDSSNGSPNPEEMTRVKVQYELKTPPTPEPLDLLGPGVKREAVELVSNGSLVFNKYLS
ncbi:hypothetical protein RHGRI_036944 [Rhododendron griersonianum]|uniref:Uncharacterized protein n=1 Tax=Rhododendron griersonianum TaxID=479676 RepID=A0AAV6HTZ8_9ERIC|nr:hypothetical protein RHGRI_036944 [Rhododendron griersonianum]